MPTASKERITPDVTNAQMAVNAAWNYFHSLFPSKPASEVSLEEVEPSPDGRHWLVTLSFEEPRRKNPKLPEFLQVPVRKYKVFKVNQDSNQVVSMKIRRVE